ncbi:uncharacterized protein METZ01_LOCUS445075 [marine metagenome]|uniref:Uncharacterized protein n=1 Tax=marine metagenome TaxID=408172 RepID=A0A382Z9Q7_9ZZZZ
MAPFYGCYLVSQIKVLVVLLRFIVIMVKS